MAKNKPIELVNIERDPPFEILQCFACKNLMDRKKMTCKAFPEGIPEEILSQQFDHQSPFNGDNGIRFEPLDSVE